MTTVSETGKAQLKIHQLTKEQYDNLSVVSPTELYVVDMGLQGGKVLVSTTDGDIVEDYSAIIREWQD